MSEAYKRFQAARGQAPAQPAGPPAGAPARTQPASGPLPVRRPVAPPARPTAVAPRAPARPRGSFGGGHMPAGDGGSERDLHAGFWYLCEYVSAETRPSEKTRKPWATVVGRVLDTNDPDIQVGEERIILHQCLSDIRVAEPIAVRFAMSFLGMDLSQGADYDAYANNGTLTNMFIGEPGFEDGAACDADGQPYPSFVGSVALVEAFHGAEVKDKPGERYLNTRAFPPANDTAPGAAGAEQ
jgi:hypothetical protein